MTELILDTRLKSNAISLPAKKIPLHMNCDGVKCLVKDYKTKSFFRMGKRRTRLPVAAKTALATTGPINGVPISPIPAGNSWLSIKCILMFGVSLSLNIG